MQRRNVDLPEPDGPMMQVTSPGWTSSDTPLRTSRRPKDLCTPSALTIGSEAMTPEPPTQTLERRRGQRATRAAAEVALDVVLADRQHRRHDQVPEARHDEQRNRLVR